MSFELVRKNIYRIPLPTPYPVGDANAYLLTRDRVPLVDCGVHSNLSHEALRQGLKGARGLKAAGKQFGALQGRVRPIRCHDAPRLLSGHGVENGVRWWSRTNPRTGHEHRRFSLPGPETG